MQDVWGILEKAQDDPQKIGEAITAAIVAHEADADSHLGDGESLKSHKASEIIDHLAGSIVDDKIANGEITAPKLDNVCKVGDVVVAPSGGDYDNLQDAIDAGYVNIYVKAGTYTITDDITIPDKLNITGEDSKLVRFDFNGSAKQFIMLGTSTVYKTNIVIKDVEFYNCHNYAITGNFLNYITVKDCRFVDCYGAIILNTSYSTRVTNVVIKNNYFNGGNSSYLTISLNSYSTNTALPSYIEQNIFDDVYNNAVLLQSSGDRTGSKYYFLNNLIKYTTKKTSGTVVNISNGFVIGNYIFKGHIAVNTSWAPVLNNHFYDQNNYAVVCYQDYNRIIGNTIDSVDGGVNKVAIGLFNVSFIQVLNNDLTNCKYKGIHLNIGTNCIISNNIIEDSLVGIDIETGSNYNIIMGNICYDCTTAIDDNGANNVVEHNIDV